MLIALQLSYDRVVSELSSKTKKIDLPTELSKARQHSNWYWSKRNKTIGKDNYSIKRWNNCYFVCRRFIDYLIYTRYQFSETFAIGSQKTLPQRRGRGRGIEDGSETSDNHLHQALAQPAGDYPIADSQK